VGGGDNAPTAVCCKSGGARKVRAHMRSTREAARTEVPTARIVKAMTERLICSICATSIDHITM
jgi:hypothetical protein